MGVISILLAFLAGSLNSVQGSVNSLIGKSSGQYVMIAGVSFLQLAFALAVVFFRGETKLIGTAPMGWMIASAVMGVVMMFSVSFSIGSIGALPVFMLLILGQVLLSAVLNHFGWLGTPQSPISWQKVGSILIILAGVVCLVKSP